MLKTAFEEGTVPVKDSLEATRGNSLKAIALAVIVKFCEFFKKELFFGVPEVFLLKVFPEVGCPDETLEHCVHVAGVSEVVETGQLVDLVQVVKVVGVEGFKVFVDLEDSCLRGGFLIEIEHLDLVAADDLNHLGPSQYSLDRDVDLRAIVLQALLQELARTTLLDVVIIQKVQLNARLDHC